MGKGNDPPRSGLVGKENDPPRSGLAGKGNDPPRSGLAGKGNDPPRSGLAGKGNDPPRSGLAGKGNDPPRSGLAGKGNDPPNGGSFQRFSGSCLSSRAVTSQVLSVYVGLTSVFGMRTGGSPQLNHRKRPLPSNLITAFQNSFLRFA